MRIWFKRIELLLKNSSAFAWRRPGKKVFYPGCSLAGADPDFCLRVYSELQHLIPGIGLWFDCCAKPSRMAGDNRFAAKQEQGLLDSLKRAGVEEVITACGNCYLQFQQFFDRELKVSSLYDLLPVSSSRVFTGQQVIHHPCFARQLPQLQEGALRLNDELGLELKNRGAAGHPLPCCLHQGKNARRRRAALQGERLLTYCAHCVVSFQDDIPSRHLLQELFGSTAVWRKSGKIKLFSRYGRFCRLAKRGG